MVDLVSIVTNKDFYPRSPCGERPSTPTTVLTLICISIHALLAESDRSHRGNNGSPIHFYPRSPCGERQRFQAVDISARRISIHALLAESDMIHPRSCNAKPNFYPRSPCGERHSAQLANGGALYFYPRSPCGERPMGLDGRFKL